MYASCVHQLDYSLIESYQVSVWLLLATVGDTQDHNYSMGYSYEFSGFELTGAVNYDFSVEEIEVFAV